MVRVILELDSRGVLLLDRAAATLLLGRGAVGIVIGIITLARVDRLAGAATLGARGGGSNRAGAVVLGSVMLEELLLHDAKLLSINSMMVSFRSKNTR